MLKSVVSAKLEKMAFFFEEFNEKTQEKSTLPD